jgi:hypothetical protein
VGKRCPICEDRQAEWDKGKGVSDKKVLQALNASWRCFYNIYDYHESLYVPWEAAYKSFEEMMQDEIDLFEKEQGGELIPWDLDDGKTLEFKGRVKQLGETEYNEPQIPSFAPRDPYDESILDQTISFDRYLTIPTYEEVCRIYYGVGDDDDTSPSESSSPPPSENRRDRRRPPSSDSERKRPSSDTGETRRRSQPPSKNDAEDDVDDRCPFGHKFGWDCNKKPECSDECLEKDFDACIDEQDKLLEKEKSKTSQEEETVTSPRQRKAGRSRGGEEKSTTRRRRA